jgi:uncharacterized membrane protein/glutaredoxin
VATTALQRPTRQPRRPRRQRRTAAPAWALDRFILGAGIVGLLVSAYLAVVDLAGGSTLCLAGSDCDVVRASTYGQIAGLPIAVLGVGYFLAVIGAVLLRSDWQPDLLQGLGGVGVGAAIVFVGLQTVTLRAWCPYCLIADVAALVIGLRVFWPRAAGNRTVRLGRGIAGAALAVAVLLVGYAAAPSSAAETAGAGAAAGGAATSTAMSADRLAALADHLRESGATFYGAYWCPHCQEQKQMFGTAASRLPYVECDARGTNAQPAACQAAGVRAYPTWVIGGQTIEGEIPPADLARLSGFDG